MVTGSQGKKGTPAPVPRGHRPGWGWPLTGASPVEALHQLGDIVCEEALPEHDAHICVAALVQHVRGLGHQQTEAIGCIRAQILVAQQAQQLRGREP